MGNKYKMYLDIMAFHEEVTGSLILGVLKLPNRETVRFAVDCGLFNEDPYYNLNDSFPFDPEKLDFVVLTHNHVDHCGRIPLLYKKGYKGKVYTSSKTKIILPLALNDSAKVLADIYKRKNQKPIYEIKDVEQALANTVGIDFNTKISVTPNIDITFLVNGHLIGAALILVNIHYPGEEDINILFTGDFNNKNDFFDIPDIPESIKKSRLTIVSEATYGNMVEADIDYNFFKKMLLDAVDNHKTTVLPVFSLGRSQEILLKLRKMQDLGELDKNIPIYFDGNLAHAYTNLYLKDSNLISEDKKDFMPENVTWVDCNTRENLLECNDSKIIVTTSGMGSYGPAQIYIPYFISKKSALILFTGYTAEGTMGYELKKSEVGQIVQVGGMREKKLADVEYCTQFSAHAKSDGLINFLKQFTNLRLVLINHGEKASKEIFADKVLEEVDTSSVGILDRNYFFRIGSYGIIKTMSTKFES